MGKFESDRTEALHARVTRLLRGRRKVIERKLTDEKLKALTIADAKALIIDDVSDCLKRALKGARDEGWLISYNEKKFSAFLIDITPDFNSPAWNTDDGVFVDGGKTAGSGVLVGAVTGASLGSVVPIVGTVIGGILGAAGGALLGKSITQDMNIEERIKLRRWRVLKYFDELLDSFEATFVPSSIGAKVRGA
jgi:hypothetical protein